MKPCSRCKVEKEITDFYKDRTHRDGHSSTCKVCSKKHTSEWAKKNIERRKEIRQKWIDANPEAHKLAKRQWKERNKAQVMADTRKRQAAQLQRIPSWFDPEPVKVLYEKARKYGFHVDHIVPLQSDIVCGFHVFANLQLMHPSENCSKGNKFWPYMPEPQSMR